MSGNNNLSGQFAALDKEKLREQKASRKDFPSKVRKPIRVVLDGVGQNYNIGAIFRLCDAMLVEHLFVCGVTVKLRNRKLVQAARGTQKWVPWSECPSAEAVVVQAKAEGYQIVVAELTANSIPPEAFIPTGPVCLVLGGESSGVSAEVAKLADTAIALPMLGQANSINVSTAAAVILYQISRQQ